MKFEKRTAVACAILCISAPATLQASTDATPPAATAFAYSISHTVKPLPAAVIHQVVDPYLEAMDADNEADAFEPHGAPVDIRVGPPRQMSRDGLCSAVASVAKANNLPIPFFANLIWQESNFDTKTISRAGAQGIAQFMPRTAVEFGLINPFEPIHALNVAGKFVRELYDQFGNLGLAAAAYNAGPRRVTDWMAKRGELPGETRNYVIRITGRPADDWAGPQIKSNPEASLMPAKAPCVEVAEAVKAQTKTVRLAKLMMELASAATQARDKQDDVTISAADMTVADAGWKGRALRMVHAMLDRLKKNEAGKAPSKAVAGAAMRSTIKVAARELGKAEDAAPGKSARKAAAKSDAKSDGRPARGKSPDKTAKAVSKAEIKSPPKAEPAKRVVKNHRRATRVAYSNSSIDGNY